MADENRLDKLINSIVVETDPEVLKKVYKEWSDTYNDDLDSFGYVAPELCINAFISDDVDKNSAILDAGCGTGLVGALLKSQGFTTVDGVDFSDGMIARAAELGCYRALSLADFSNTLSIDSDAYNGILSVGVYSGRIKQHFLAEMIRILKPGGKFVMTCREQYIEGLLASITDLHLKGELQSIHINIDDYMTGQNATAHYVTLYKKQPS